MAKVKNLDDRIQFCSLDILTSVADTPRAVAFPTGATVREKVGVLIHSIDFWLNSNSYGLINAAADSLTMSVLQIALNIPTNAIPWPAGVIDTFGLTNAAAAVNVLSAIMPFRHTFPEPVLAHPASLYGGVASIGLGGVAGGTIRLGFTYVDLSDSDYQDILQTIIMQNIL